MGDETRAKKPDGVGMFCRSGATSSLTEPVYMADGRIPSEELAVKTGGPDLRVSHLSR
jgi:hypothetical protein